MGKIVVKSLLGVLIIFSGLGIVGYIYLKGISDNNLWILGVASILIVVGILFLNRALNDTESSKQAMLNDSSNAEVYQSDGKNQLERNNEMVEQWKQTSDARDRLKLLEAAGNAEQGQG